jgi:outer membrane protein assembly factor BamB
MRLTRPRAALALAALVLSAAPAPAVITKLTPLAEVLDGDDFIFVAAVGKVDPDKPSAVFTVAKKLKGDPPFDRLPVNMAGNDEAKKAGDTKTVLDRLGADRKVVFFVSKRGKRYNAKAFVEGSWFSVQGTEDEADKVVRWAFQNGEPFLRRTFKGTSAELVKVVEDGLAKRAKPPAPDEKEKPGYGPPAEKKCDDPSGRTRSVSDGVATPEPVPVGPRPVAWAEGGRAFGPQTRSPEGATSLRPGHRPGSHVDGPGSPSAHPVAHAPGSPALFAVIPSLALVGPLAVLAALFPGLAARLAVGMKRWRAFLVVASLNTTLAFAYWLVRTQWPGTLPNSWWAGPTAFTLYLMLVTAVGLSWAGRRYRRMGAADAAVTATPGRTEPLTLAGLAAAVGLIAALVAWQAGWAANFDLPMRDITFVGIAALAAGLYAGYRVLTAAADGPPAADPPPVRLSLSGETVALGVLLLCGFVTVLLSGRAGYGPVATGTVQGADDAIGPRLVGVKTFPVNKATQVLSGVTVAGDRLYFGTKFVTSSEYGQLVCMDRETGEEKWRFEADDDLEPVFCTPTVAGGKVYCGEGLHENKNCRLFCVDAATGKPAWAAPFKTASHTEGAPAVGGGRVFFPAGDDGLIAADAATGAERWRLKGGKDAGIHIDAAPALSADGTRVFVGSGLYTYVAVALDAATGKELWRTDLKLRAFGAPLAAGKFVYYGIGTGNMGADTHDYDEEGGAKEKAPAGAVVCLDAATGKEQWRHDLPRSVHTGLAADAFSVYAGCRDGFVYALDRKTGKLRWKTGIGGAVTSCPAVATAGGVPVAVYAVGREGLAVCLNPHTGKVVWERQLPGFQWDGVEGNGVLSGPTVVTTGSRRAVYVGALTASDSGVKSAAVFRFDDDLDGG